MKPRFARLPGELVSAQPFRLERVFEVHWVFKGDFTQIDTTLDRMLNQPFERGRYFSASSALVLLTATNVSCHAGCPADKWQAGTCHRQDCARAFQLDEKRRETASLKFNLLRFTVFVTTRDGKRYALSPYSFIDDGTALAFYRETYGMRMTLGEFRFPAADPYAGIDTYMLDCEARVLQADISSFCSEALEPMLNIQPVGKKHSTATTTWTKRSALVNGVSADLSAHPEVSDATVITDHICMRDKAIALKQFRSLPDGKGTLFKGIPNYHRQLERFHVGGLLPRTFALGFPNNSLPVKSMYPIREDLGLEDGQQSLATYYMLSDFNYRSGRILVDATRKG